LVFFLLKKREPSFSKLFSSLVDNFLKRRTTVLVDLFSKFLNDCILILQVIKTDVDQFNDLLLELSADAFFYQNMK